MKYKSKYNLKTWLIKMLQQLKDDNNKIRIEKEIKKLQKTL